MYFSRTISEESPYIIQPLEDTTATPVRRCDCGIQGLGRLLSGLEQLSCKPEFLSSDPRQPCTNQAQLHIRGTPVLQVTQTGRSQEVAGQAA